MRASNARPFTLPLQRPAALLLATAVAVAVVGSRTLSQPSANAGGSGGDGLSIPALQRHDVRPTPLVAVADLHGDWHNALLSLQLT